MFNFHPGSFSTVVSRKKPFLNAKMSNLEMDSLQKQNMTSGHTPVRRELESEATVDTGSLKMDRGVLE